MTRQQTSRLIPAIAIAMLFISAVIAVGSPTTRVMPPAFVRLPAGTQLGNRLAAGETVSFALTLPVEDPAGLGSFLKKVYDPHDPLYAHYLTPSQFADRFGPTTADYQALESTAVANGLTINRTYGSRMVLDVEGPAGVVEPLLNVHLYHAQSPDGHVYRVADMSPTMRAPFAALGAAALGLDDAPAAHPHLLTPATNPPPASSPIGLQPSDIRQIYDIPSIPAPAQTVALMELDGYYPGDIQQYRTAFGISGTPVQNVSVDGASNTQGPNADEVDLDIELVLSLDPNGAGILVYEAPNDTQGQLDALSRIASDDAAKLVSSSWGSPETSEDAAYLTAESQTFAEMAAQGQTVFASSGDDGADDNGRSLSVDDPASQPMVTAIGGTSLTLTPSGGYGSETTWNNDLADASGGGASVVWPAPSYQHDASLPASMRLLPDIAIDADPNSGYAFYYSDPKSGPGWYVAGGTSAGPPLWSDIMAMVNQQRSAGGLGPIGFVNPAIYLLATNTISYQYDFHDITTGNNNHYTAGPGFDECTGWGTPIGASLIADLSAAQPALQAGLTFFSVPYDYTGTPVSDIFDQPITLYNWDPVTEAYVSTPNPPSDTVHQMVGYWANFPATTHLTTTGADLTGGHSETLALQPGWNMIGNPFDLDVPLSDVTISTTGGPLSLSAANAAGLVYSTLYAYDPFINAYVGHAPDNLAPYTGYWIKAFSACSVTISHP
jgi:kumamolisin